MSGTNIKFITKRGTNQYHGSLFYQGRNEFFNANSWSRNAQNQARNKSRLHEAGRSTYNNTSDGGIVLKNGLTVKDLQNAMRTSQSTIGDGRSFWFLDPKFIGPDTQASKDWFGNPTEPGQYVSGPIILYGKNYFNIDLALNREIRIKERFRLSIWAQALNALNHPSFLPTSIGGINASNFALISGPSGNRTMQFRVNVKF